MVVLRGKRGDYRLETVTWEEGKGGEGMVWVPAVVPAGGSG